MINYSGHGGTTSWADGPPFYQSDVNGLTNAEIASRLFGQLDLGDDIAQALAVADRVAGHGVRQKKADGVPPRIEPASGDRALEIGRARRRRTAVARRKGDPVDLPLDRRGDAGRPL